MIAKTSHPQYDITSSENLTWRERDLEVAHSVDGEVTQAVIDSLAGISPALVHHIAAFGFGDVYSRPGLNSCGRQLVAIDVLTTLGDCEPQLRIHIGAVFNVGLTREEIVEAILHVSVYADFPRALSATLVAREVFVERDVTD